MEIRIGAAHTESVLVDAENIASAVGSGMVEVFATPMMVALFELAASRCLAGFLDDGMVSVGTHINIDHSDATPVGMTVSATATIEAVDRRRVDFSIVVTDDAGEVGRGRHTRFVVDRAKFAEKALARREGGRQTLQI